MKTLNQWLEEYGESHLNPVNKSIHYLCVPAIFWSICGLLFAIKLPFEVNGYRLSATEPALLLVTLYYWRLSLSLLPASLILSVICLWSWQQIESLGHGTWLPALIIFVVAWIGQFIGHHIEGKRPSFLKDLQFLLIGPAWVIRHFYQKTGIL